MDGRKVTDTIVIGFALCAFFLGTGGLILPPAIGLAAGREWGSALLGFAVPGALLPVLAFAAVVRAGGPEGVASEMGKTFSILFTSLVMLCAGLLIAIPKTAAAVHELGITADFGPVPQFLISCAFFAAVFYLSSDFSATVEAVGKYLAPALLAIMTVIIAKGVLNPLDIPIDTGIPGTFAFRWGFVDGCRNMNVFGGLIFSGAILAAVAARQRDNRRARVTAYCYAAVAGLGLLFIYGGLLYLGATGSSLFDAHIGDAELMVRLIDALFKGFGPSVFAFATVLACLTAAVGLTSGASHFFSGMTKGKLSYKACVAVTCVTSLSISAMDIYAVTHRAAQLLVFIHPVAIVLVLLNALRCSLVNRGTFIGAVCGALVVGFLEMLSENFMPHVSFALRLLPFYVDGFAWAVPAMACGILGTLCCALLQLYKKEPKGEYS